MTYKEYFKQSDFSEVWKTLCATYKEPEESRPLYQLVHRSVCELNVDTTYSNHKIEVYRGTEKDVFVKGAPDPQEWLVGREVVTEFEVENVNELVGHLLYWSTLYGIKTQKMQEEVFSKWLKYCSRGTYFTIPEDDLDRLDESVMVKYIFLDFDGVLNTEQYQAQLAIDGNPTKDEYVPLFDPKTVARLSEIIESTKAEIVVTSSWQNIHSAEILKDMWEKRGLPGVIRLINRKESEQVSHEQVVNAFIRERTFLPFVIFDDDDNYPQEFHQNLIKINPITGISSRDVTAAIEALNVYDNVPSSYFFDSEYEDERDRIGKINAESCERKRLRYWENTILNDEPYDWSFNLIILRKKIEYNIGYYRLTQRFVGWEQAVAKMSLSCRLISIALGEDDDKKVKYININNCTRFHNEPSDIDNENEDFYLLWKRDLRKAKAYKIFWVLLSRYMKSWWD